MRTQQQLKNRVNRIEKELGGGQTLFAVLSSPQGAVDDGPEVEAAIARDIPTEVRARTSSVVTISTGVPRADIGPRIQVDNWWFGTHSHEEALS